MSRVPDPHEHMGAWNSGHPGAYPMGPPGTPQELLKYHNSVIFRLFGTRGSTPKADWPPGCVSGGLDVQGTPWGHPRDPHMVTLSFIDGFGCGVVCRNRAAPLGVFLGGWVLQGHPGDPHMVQLHRSLHTGVIFSFFWTVRECCTDQFP